MGRPSRCYLEPMLPASVSVGMIEGTGIGEVLVKARYICLMAHAVKHLVGRPPNRRTIRLRNVAHAFRAV